MPFLQISWVFGFACMALFWRAGQIEAQSGTQRNNGPLWALLSCLVSALVIHGADGGWLFVLLANAGLLVGIGTVRALWDMRG